MNRKKAASRICSLVLAVLLVLGTLPHTVFAADETFSSGTGREITAFEALEDSVKKQTVPTGTSLEELNLPDMLSATVADTPAEVTVASWMAQPEYKSDIAGKYVFVPVLESGYILTSGIILPTAEITVSIADANDTAAEKEEAAASEVDSTAILESHIQTDVAGALFGTQSTTVTIGSADDLVTFANNINNNTYPANTNAVLTSDINMEGKTWTPIGNFAHRYQGTFDGNNHVILNLTYTTANSQAGVFGMTTNGAVINNLGVTGIFSGNEYIGGLIGYAEGTTIENCWNGASISGSGGNIGGLVGSLGEWGNSLIKNCYNYGSITGTYSVGGIVGTLGDYGEVLNCFSYAEPVRSIAGAIPWGGRGVTNSYYLSTSQGTSSLGTAATEEQFKWGEVAWLLNEQNSNGIWKQIFGTDAYPKFTGNDVTQPINKPSVSVSVPAAVNIGQTLPLTIPTVDDNGNNVTAQGWEISSDGSTNWIAFVPETTMTYAHNRQYLRYYATNIVSTGYSNIVQITVNKLNLSLSLSCSDITYGGTPNPQLTGNTGGAEVTYEYKVQGSLDSGYSATVPGDAGTYTVRASVAATDTYNAASATANFSIAKATPVMNLTASPIEGSLADDTVTLTAALTGVDPIDYPTGSIVFKNGGTILDTVLIVNGEASYTWQNVPYGTHNLTAEYAGDTNYQSASGSISNYDVEKKTQDTLSITGVPQSLTFGDSSFTLGTTGGSGGGSVTYILQSGDAVSVSGNTVTIENAGTAVIQATKATDGIYNETDAAITITVVKATPVMNLTASSIEGSLADDTVTLTAALTGVDPIDYPTGSIVFKNGGTILDTVLIVNGEASYTWQNVPHGTHNLTAEYTGDTNYENITGSITGYDVQKRMQATLTITGAPASIVYGDVSFTLGTTGGNGNGLVTYTIQSGDAVSISGNTVTIVKAGTVVIQATKAADSIYNETSATITLTVGKAAPTIQANPSVNGVNVGKALSTVSLSGLKAYGVGGSDLTGSFVWENPQTVVQGAGRHSVIFTPTDTVNYNSITFEVQVNLGTTKPVIASVQAIPSINGTKLEVKATAGTPLTYQWQVKGSWIDIPGATSAVFDYTGLSANTEYTVRVIVKDANGNSTTSESITFKTGKQAVSGLPGDAAITGGNSVTWTPNPPGGTWDYDSDFLSMSEKDGTVTFTAKKTGKTTVKYTVNGTEQVINITVAENTAPRTGDSSNLGLWSGLLCISIIGIGGVLMWSKKRNASSRKEDE